MAIAKRDVVRALGRCQLGDCEGGALKAGRVVGLLLGAEGLVMVLFLDRIGGRRGVPIPPRSMDAMEAAVSSVPGVARVRMERRPVGSASPSAAAYAAAARRAIDFGPTRVVGETGARVGVVDADGYGFRMPTLLGAVEPPRTALFDPASEPGLIFSQLARAVRAAAEAVVGGATVG